MIYDQWKLITNCLKEFWFKRLHITDIDGNHHWLAVVKPGFSKMLFKMGQIGVSELHLQCSVALKGSEECVIRQMILGRTSSSESCKVSKFIIFYCWSYWIKKKFLGLHVLVNHKKHQQFSRAGRQYNNEFARITTTITKGNLDLNASYVSVKLHIFLPDFFSSLPRWKLHATCDQKELLNSALQMGTWIENIKIWKSRCLCKHCTLSSHIILCWPFSACKEIMDLWLPDKPKHWLIRVYRTCLNDYIQLRRIFASRLWIQWNPALWTPT